MVVAGAGGHAIEIWEILNRQNISSIVFFEETKYPKRIFFNDMKVIHDLNEIRQHFIRDPYFVLGTGGVELRKKMANTLVKMGGILTSVIDSSAIIGKKYVQLENGINIMDGVNISSMVNIGEGSLINRNASIHHDCTIGKYCEIGPGSIICGGVQLGNEVMIGAGVTILPGITIGNGTIIGAGAIVTKHVLDYQKLAGNPAKNIIK